MQKNLEKTDSRENYKDHLYILIYCGGGGTRLWPYSRDKAPKQFLSFNGDKTLIRKTFERVKSVVPLENIYIITLPDYTDEVHKFLHEIPKDQVIVEPARRDTLLAAGLGAVLIQKKDPNAVIVNQWSDQLVEGVDKYRDALFAGAETAWTKKVLVTTGVRPEYPHPGLEYVRKGEHLSQKNGVDVYKVDKFIERPERSGRDVDDVFKDKRSLWHATPWIWRADTFLAKVKKHSLGTHKRLTEIASLPLNSDWSKNVEKIYKESPKVQIDMVISKDQGEMYVVEGEYDWLDLGDFNVLWKMAKKDQNHNASLLKKDSEWINVNSEGTYVLSYGKKTIVTSDVKDMVIVALEDAILIIPRDKTQNVKKVVELLKEQKRTDLL